MQDGVFLTTSGYENSLSVSSRNGSIVQSLILKAMFVNLICTDKKQ